MEFSYLSISMESSDILLVGIPKIVSMSKWNAEDKICLFSIFITLFVYLVSVGLGFIKFTAQYISVIFPSILHFCQQLFHG